MQNYYKAGVESLDFSKASTLKRINRWCSDHTDGMIPKIIEQVDADAVSYIMNAIYFNGTWTDKFDTRQTKLENFQGYTRDIKKTQMMHRNGKYQYMDNADFAAVNLPYGNGSYSMTVILPNRGKSIDEVMAGLDAKKVSELGRSMDECVVDLKLPRFTISQETRSVGARKTSCHWSSVDSWHYQSSIRNRIVPFCRFLPRNNKSLDRCCH